MDSTYIRLPTGRLLAYAQFGDSKGKPIFFFHGWPSSRNAAAKFHVLAKKLKIRIISPDRPGFGLSDYQENRTLLDWPDDVLKIAAHLKMKKFAVLGVSGGGPYAAVCGYKIHKYITRLGIVVGLGPKIDRHSTDGVMWYSRIGWDHFDNPIFRRATMLIQYYGTYHLRKLGLDRSFFGAKADKALYANVTLRQSVTENYYEAFRRGYRGVEHDLKIYAGDWGFPIRDILAKTYLWYGAKDRNVSLNMGKYYLREIKGSRLTVYPDEGHLISVSHAEEIFRTMTSG